MVLSLQVHLSPRESTNCRVGSQLLLHLLELSRDELTNSNWGKAALEEIVYRYCPKGGFEGGCDERDPHSGPPASREQVPTPVSQCRLSYHRTQPIQRKYVCRLGTEYMPGLDGTALVLGGLLRVGADAVRRNAVPRNGPSHVSNSMNRRSTYGFQPSRHR